MSIQQNAGRFIIQNYGASTYVCQLTGNETNDYYGLQFNSYGVPKYVIRKNASPYAYYVLATQDWVTSQITGAISASY